MKRFTLLLILSFLIFVTAFDDHEKKDTITWYSLEEAQQLAKENDKKVLVYAEAVWCTYCKKMEREVFPKERVIKSITKYYYPVRVDIESDKKMKFNGEAISESRFARKYRVTGTPTTFFINKRGQILGAQPGFIPADIFEQLLGYVGSDAYDKMEFEEYVEQGG